MPIIRNKQYKFEQKMKSYVDRWKRKTSEIMGDEYYYRGFFTNKPLTVMDLTVINEYVVVSYFPKAIYKAKPEYLMMNSVDHYEWNYWVIGDEYIDSICYISGDNSFDRLGLPRSLSDSLIFNECVENNISFDARRVTLYGPRENSEEIFFTAKVKNRKLFRFISSNYYYYYRDGDWYDLTEYM